MISQDKNLLNETLYIFKSEKLYGKIENKRLFKLHQDNLFIENENNWDELLDILPQGKDLTIMKNSFNLKDDKEIFYFLKNPIGDFYFSTSQEFKPDDLKLSTIKDEKISFPNELMLSINIDYSQMYPTSHHSSQNQKLSISGYQHKLQILIDQKEIKEYYSNFSLKPASRELSKVAINEHLNTTFLKEFGFEIPFNAIIFDERFGEGNYKVVTTEFPIAAKYTYTDNDGNTKVGIMAGTMDMLIYDDEGNFKSVLAAAKKAGFEIAGASAYSARRKKVYCGDDPVAWFDAIDAKCKYTQWRGRFKAVIEKVIKYNIGSGTFFRQKQRLFLIAFDVFVSREAD